MENCDGCCSFSCLCKALALLYCDKWLAVHGKRLRCLCELTTGIALRDNVD